LLLDKKITEDITGRKVAEEVWTSNKVDYFRLRVFGCPAYVHVPSEERSKLDLKSRQLIFLGYEKWVKRYKLWDPTANRVVISRDVVFDENAMLKSTLEKEQQVPKKIAAVISRWWRWRWSKRLRCRRLLLRVQRPLPQVLMSSTLLPQTDPGTLSGH